MHYLDLNMKKKS